MIGKLVYRLFKNQIHEELVKEFIGCVPKVRREPVLEFLSDKKHIFESFLEIQAYNMQKRMVMDNNNAQKYEGALIIIRAFLAAVSMRNKDLREKVSLPEEKDSLDEDLKKISSFMDFGKKITNP